MKKPETRELDDWDMVLIEEDNDEQPTQA